MENKKLDQFSEKGTVNGLKAGIPKVRKVFKKRDVGEGGIDLVESNVKPSIRIEQISEGKNKYGEYYKNHIKSNNNDRTGSPFIDDCETSYDHYNGSYAQDYEGWSDQEINDVFDGNPDAYWNID
jgi:hypothetical protein